MDIKTLKPGDKVRVLHSEYSCIRAGEIGEVVFAYETLASVDVDFGQPRGWRMRRTGYFRGQDVERAPAELKIVPRMWQDGPTRWLCAVVGPVPIGYHYSGTGASPASAYADWSSRVCSLAQEV